MPYDALQKRSGGSTGQSDPGQGRAPGKDPGQSARAQAAEAKGVLQLKTGDESDEKKGKELWVKRSVLGFPYHHAGVHIGGDQVVHVTAEPLQAVKDLLAGNPIVKVRNTSFSDFAGGDAVTVGPAPHAYDPDDASMRAQSLVGLPWSYDPLDKNCQHFSSEMVSGQPASPEASMIKSAFAAVLEAPGTAAKAVKAGAKKAGSWLAKGAKSLAGSVKGLFG